VFEGTIGSVSELNNTIELLTEIDAVILDIDMIEKANLVANF
jgi:ribosome maturation factor RimP